MRKSKSQREAERETLRQIEEEDKRLGQECLDTVQRFLEEPTRVPLPFEVGSVRWLLQEGEADLTDDIRRVIFGWGKLSGIDVTPILRLSYEAGLSTWSQLDWWAEEKRLGSPPTYLTTPSPESLEAANKIAAAYFGRTSDVPSALDIFTLEDGFLYSPDPTLRDFATLYIEERRVQLAVLIAWGELLKVDVDPILKAAHGPRDENALVVETWEKLKLASEKKRLFDWNMRDGKPGVRTSSKVGSRKGKRPSKNAKLVEFAKRKRDEGLAWKAIALEWNRDHPDDPMLGDTIRTAVKRSSDKNGHVR